MPRRRAPTGAQPETLLALPTAEPDLVRHWMLDQADLAAVDRRRGAQNQLGYALQLCAFRFPGRLLRPGEPIPEAALHFVAGQLHVGPDVLAGYARRPQTRREQLDALRAAYDFRMFARRDGRGLLDRLLPVALATTDAQAVAATLMDELRRRRIVLAGPSTAERLVAAALTRAERHVALQLTRGLTPAQAGALEALLRTREGTAVSVLAWVRQPAGAPGHRALAHLVERLGILRAVGLDPSLAEGVHPERLRKLAREGGRFTAQHLRALAPLRRRATLVAAVLDAATRLTDGGVELFDRAVGRMFRRAEAREQDALLRDTRAINDKVRLLARLGAALIEAREAKADLEAAVADAVGWDRLARGVAEAERLAWPDAADRGLAQPRRPGQAAAAPGRGVGRGRLQGGGDRALDLRVGDPARRPGPGLVQQAIRPALGEAAPPQRHCRPAHTDCLRDATVGAARLGAGQHDAGAGGQRLPRLPAAHPALQQAVISLGQHDRDRMRVGHGRASAADASNQQRNGAPPAAKSAKSAKKSAPQPARSQGGGASPNAAAGNGSAMWRRGYGRTRIGYGRRRGGYTLLARV